ncbi:alginate lyase family protein [Chitinophaga sp. GCM10012297]|uniref:Alginate lyase family protein n=1 Tax=Chitinophaga chungangae TaxID=2821488 RepID=A0ABS3YFV5_9BACT|nr:alginate lyase family protein [Chitinophaga chungangae]MBO9153558.1 alginate lyase family protein [Chitinophaga chungangae]
MKNILSWTKLMLCLLLSLQSFAEDTPRTFLMRPETLVKGKQLVRQGDAAMVKALGNILKEADAALKKGPYSVVSKEKMPPSGDKHDYMSVGPYWWPDSTKKNGLPYIRKDGQVNPERYAVRDAEFHTALCRDVYMLSIAWYYTGKKEYASHAARLLRAWFIDPATKMNPNLNFGQSIPGITEGRGIGLIDTKALAKLLDGISLLKGSAFLQAGEETAIRDWYASFLQWMRTSPIGMDEADEHNNHGTWYDVQTVSIALFLEDKALAEKILKEQTIPRIESQLKPDGSQPHELARTLSWNYSQMNLKGFFELARLAENVRLNLWTMETPGGKSLKKAFGWMLGYADENSHWEYKQIKPRNVKGFTELARLAAPHYPEFDVRKLLSQEEDQQSDLVLLTGSTF